MKRLRNGFMAIVAAGLALGLAACGGDATPVSSDSPQTSSSPTVASTPVEQVDLMVYSGAGLKKPMEQVKVEFEAANPGVTVVYTYAGSAQLLAQIESSGKGDVFIPGSQDSYDVANQKGLAGPAELIAHHTPAIGVAKGNPANVTSLADLANPGVRVALGDPEANAIGITAKKLFEKNGITGVDANVVTYTATVNEIFNAIEAGNADAAVITIDSAFGRENIVDVIEIPADQNIDQIIPACTLTTSENAEIAQKFVDFMATEGKQIFAANGYEVYQG